MPGDGVHANHLNTGNLAILRRTAKMTWNVKDACMKFHDLRVWRSAEPHAREEELAWQLTELASDPVAVDQDVIEMIGNRIIDNA